MAQVGLLEDNTRIAKLCATILQYEGHQVTVYEHPRKCLSALLAQPMLFGFTSSRGTPLTPLPVDILILDLHLPDIDGVEVLHLLRSHPRTQTLPLIFCTAATSAEIARAKRLAPEAGFIEKPFKFQTLVSAISTALNGAAK